MNINGFKSLTIADVWTCSLFLAGFVFAVTDMNFLAFFQLILGVAKSFTFFIVYASTLIFLMMLIKVFIKNIGLFRITKEDYYGKKGKINKFYKGFFLISIGYFSGIFISFSNACLLVLFAKYIY